MYLRRYAAGNFIITKAKLDTDVYFLVSGKVRSCAFSASGKQVHFEDLDVGTFFGELAAIDEGQRSGECVAMDEVTVGVMSRNDFLDTARRYPVVFDALLRRLASMVRLQMQRVYELSSCSVNQRIRFELLRLTAEGGGQDSLCSEVKNIQSPPTHAEIATRIGARREAVTRELKKLETSGVITWRRGKHCIHDLTTLMELATSGESLGR